MEFNQFDLHGKVAIVTGGNGGIGLGIARGLARAGADIAVAGRNADKTRDAIEQLTGLGVRAVGLQADVTDEAQVHQMVAQTVEKLGRVDILIANAGMSIRKTPESYTLADWSQLIAPEPPCYCGVRRVTSSPARHCRWAAASRARCSDSA